MDQGHGVEEGNKMMGLIERERGPWKVGEGAARKGVK